MAGVDLLRGWYYKHSPLAEKTEAAMIEFDVELDASGLMCPLPLLRLKKVLAEMTAGEVVKVLATDPAAHLDIGVYVDQTGHYLIEIIRHSSAQIFYIRKN